MSYMDETGVYIDTVAETRTAMSDSLKTAHSLDDFKSDDPQSIAGQDVWIVSGMIREQNELILGLAEMFNPQAARGLFLSNLVTFNGLRRKEAKYSTVPVELTAGTASTVIEEGALVTDINETVEWALTGDVELDQFEAKIASFQCVKEGPFVADPGTLTVIKTRTYSWESATNTAAASPGRVEETDPDLRNRRNTSSKKTGQCSTPDIFRNLTEIEGTESVNINVNESDTVDPDTGQPSGSIWCIVKGGTDQDIAEVLTKNVAGGIKTFGSIEVIYTDVITAADGTVYSKDYYRYFDRQTDKITYLDIQLTKTGDYPPDGDVQMRQQIIDYYTGDFTIDGRKVPGFQIGRPIVHSRLYTPINSIVGHSVVSLYVNLDDFGTGVADIPMAKNEQGFVSEPYIRINGEIGP